MGKLNSKVSRLISLRIQKVANSILNLPVLSGGYFTFAKSRTYQFGVNRVLQSLVLLGTLFQKGKLSSKVLFASSHLQGLERVKGSRSNCKASVVG